MSSGNPWSMILALALMLSCAGFGALVLWLWDQACRLVGRWHELDRCLTCGKTLRYQVETGTYQRHRCRPL